MFASTDSAFVVFCDILATVFSHFEESEADRRKLSKSCPIFSSSFESLCSALPSLSCKLERIARVMFMGLFFHKIILFLYRSDFRLTMLELFLFF